MYILHVSLYIYICLFTLPRSSPRPGPRGGSRAQRSPRAGCRFYIKYLKKSVELITKTKTIIRLLSIT